MKELSVFIDESGDFGEIKERPAYYLVTFVFHDQDNTIAEQVSKLEESVRSLGHNVEYIHTGPVIRREATDKIALSGKLAKAINRAMNEHMDFFADFEKIIVYYDNGQVELSTILNAVFSIQFFNVEFRKAEPQKYRLLQAADFICFMELLKIKWSEKRLSKSEEHFFYKPQELKKTFFRSIAKKKL